MKLVHKIIESLPYRVYGMLLDETKEDVSYKVANNVHFKVESIAYRRVTIYIIEDIKDRT